MYVVTAATGALGALAVQALLNRVPAEQIRATGRRVEALADVAARGVDVRRADYDDPASLRAAFDGATRVLFVSGSEVGQRRAQHGAVVDALAATDVELVAYTSILHAQRSDMILAEEHAATERMLAEAGVPHVLLRNGWYVENFTQGLADKLRDGITGSSGAGRFAVATRADYAEAAAAALTGAAAPGQVYELGGPGFTQAELAAELGRAAGHEVGYTDLSAPEHTAALRAAGVPEMYATLAVDIDRGAAAGLLSAPEDDLTRLLGRRPAPWAKEIHAAVRKILD